MNDQYYKKGKEPKITSYQLKKIAPHIENLRNIERAVIPSWAEKSEKPIRCKCGAPIFEDDYDGICWECFQKERDEMNEYNYEDELEERRDLSPKENFELRI